MSYLKFIVLTTLFLASCTCLKSGFTEEACLEKLQKEIKKNWVILEDIGEYFPVTYQRNDGFCNQVCEKYTKCLVGKKNKEDIKALFGNRGINLQYLLEYHCKSNESYEIMRFEFAFDENSTLKEIRYRPSNPSNL